MKSIEKIFEELLNVLATLIVYTGRFTAVSTPDVIEEAIEKAMKEGKATITRTEKVGGKYVGVLIKLTVTDEHPTNE